MTLYEELIDLKYRKGVTTYELLRRFPGQIERVSEVALLQVPDEILREIVREKETLERLLGLKQEFLEILERSDSEKLPGGRQP